MKAPQLRLADLVAPVGIAALGSAAYRAVGHSELFLVGAVPMATVLAVVWLLSHWRRGGRTFLAFGAAALALYIVVVANYRFEVVRPYLHLSLDPFFTVLGYNPAVLPLAYTLAIVVLGTPQLAVALVGGLIVWSSRSR